MFFALLARPSGRLYVLVGGTFGRGFERCATDLRETGTQNQLKRSESHGTAVGKLGPLYNSARMYVPARARCLDHD
jgi:hypothetical protein